MGTIIQGIGVYRPENVVTNKDIEKIVATTDEWIVTRTGIHERRIVPKDSPLLASDMGKIAALEAITKAGVNPEQIGAIIVAAVASDKQFPATACFLQEKIGAKNAFAFDVTAACAGFVFSINLADQIISSGQCEYVLVVGAELLSRIVDWTDRNTCILFGDAAGAVVLGKGPANRGIIRSILRSDGAEAGILYLDHAGSDNFGLRMDGKQVFKLAVSEVSKIVVETLDKEGLKPSDLDLLVMHQANIRILHSISEKLNLPPEKVVINVDRFGNTSSASVPLALYEAEEAGRLKPGMLVALAAVGGGMSWGCNLMRW